MPLPRASTTSPAPPRPALRVDGLTPLRLLDLAIMLVALPVFVAAGLPVLGWVTGAGVWVMWRGIGLLADRRARGSDDLRTVVGTEVGSMVGRGWLLGGGLLAAGILGGDDVGLSGAVLAIILFTVFFTTKMVVRPFDAAARPPRRAAPRT